MVSVVITTKNEEKHIANCLESIKKQTFPQNKIEIIVVDNDSIDKTVQIAKKYTSLVFNKGPERSAQRNFGMLNKARGELVMFLDADMILSPKVISSCVTKLTKNPKTIALYVSEVIMGDSFWSRVRRLERSFYDATIADCVRFLRREAFIKVKGFDTQFTGPEDWDLDKKIRALGKVYLIKEPIYHNESNFNLLKYLNKKNYYAHSFQNYINKWGKNDPDVVKQFSPIYRGLIIFLEQGKWKKLISHPLEALGMFFLRFLVGLIYLKNLFKI